MDANGQLRQDCRMSSLSRKLRRASEQKAARAGFETYSLMEKLALVASTSLGFTDEQAFDGMSALFKKNPEGGRTAEGEELGDILLARVLDVLELVRKGKTADDERIRLELEARHEPGFLLRVAGMGNSASSVVDQCAELMLAEG